MKKAAHILFVILFFGTSLLNAQTEKKTQNLSFDLELGLDGIFYFESGAFDGQKQFYPGLFMRPKFKYDWDKGKNNIIFEGFARWDSNGDSRTHWDIRELYYQYYKDNWEFNIGSKRVFWGKTEGVHLVDVINQVDFLEGIDGEEKLGQPMVQVSYTNNIGTFSAFALPYTRTLEFGNESGRLRPEKIPTDDQISFESNNEEWHPSFALRWSHYIGDADLGFHYFYGNAREPIVVFDENGFGLEYSVVHQVGLDYQHIVGSAIFKLESVYRAGDFINLDNIFAMTGGVEYTFGNVNGKGLDIGVLGEYVYDNRRELSFSSLDNDLFIASRLAFNNVAGTELLFGVFQDLSKSTKSIRLEYSQRLGESFKIEATGQGFLNVDNREFVSQFQQDSFFEIALIKYF
ncbi:hypothetical protein [uncultured Aquimarina sp.]|uniref:hypothetical protein n=1 Tax=uncultured Aquimarina sp. TaxID=575652 RepID=UPI0026376862|nr:hypothetical protein [uncultured Aquimarina sp.]